jgi:ferric-dicitrate binding protein FerR (iron transport regulator)
MAPEKKDERDFSFLEHYNSIDLEKDWANVKQRMDFQKKDRSRNLSLLRWAAAFLLVAGFSVIAARMILNQPEIIRHVAQEAGEELTLPDRSVVVLNKDASLTYPEKFRGQTRDVGLQGEAFFEVTSDPKRRFTIDVDSRARVEVLGTSFHVSSTPADSSIEVQVVDGRVAFSAGEGKHFFQITLAKGEQAALTGGRPTKIENPDPNFMSWKTGILSFDETSLEEVILQLSKFYDADIALDPGLSGSLTFTSTIEDQDLESVLDEISLVLGLSYRLKGSEYLLYEPE